MAQEKAASPTVCAHITDAQKFFQDHQKPQAKLKVYGGKTPQLGGTTRWTARRENFQTFIYNHPFYVRIRDEDPALFPAALKKILDDRQVLKGAEHMLEQLDLVVHGLNIMQSDSSHLGDCMNTWIMLSSNSDLTEDLREEIRKRMEKTITPFHILAKIVMNKAGAELPSDQKDKAMDYIEEIDDRLPGMLAAFEMEDITIFPPQAFKASIRNVLEPVKYWKYVSNNTQLEPLKVFCDLAVRVLSCPPSSAGLERAFSSFGLVHSKLRNRLGNERVMKLVRTYCHLRDKEADDDDCLELLENADEDEMVTKD